MIYICFVLIFFVPLPYNQQIRNIMVPKILSYFCSLKDPRIERKKLHPLLSPYLYFIFSNLNHLVIQSFHFTTENTHSVLKKIFSTEAQSSQSSQSCTEKFVANSSRI